MIETEVIVGTGLKITVSKDELVGALGVVSRAVSTRTSVQILSGILLEARNESAGAGELRLAATDMELSLRATVVAQLDGDGAIVLPGKTFADIARLLPSDEVTIEHKPAESVVHVTSGSASYTLHTYNPEDFPRLPELGAVQTFSRRSRGSHEPLPATSRAPCSRASS
jgi:DNA polymerase-3 subunit beta